MDLHDDEMVEIGGDYKQYCASRAEDTDTHQAYEAFAEWECSRFLAELPPDAAARVLKEFLAGRLKALAASEAAWAADRNRCRAQGWLDDMAYWAGKLHGAAFAVAKLLGD